MKNELTELGNHQTMNEGLATTSAVCQCIFNGLSLSLSLSLSFFHNRGKREAKHEQRKQPSKKSRSKTKKNMQREENILSLYF